MRDYKKLEVWSNAHQLYMHVKKDIAVKFPKEEKYEPASQLQRADLSIPLNIVERCETKAMPITFIKFLRR